MAGRKMVRFTSAPDGTLVYAATGKAARADYYIVRDRAGRASVYRVADNRVGRVRVGSYTDPKNLGSRQKAAVRNQQRKRGWGGSEGLQGPMGPASAQVLRPKPTPEPYREPDIYDMMKAADQGLLSVKDQAQVNYNKLLDYLVKEGRISEEDAAVLRAEYQQATDPERTMMWDDLYNDYPPMEKNRYHRGDKMVIDMTCSMLPYWDAKGNRGGYKLAVMYDTVMKRHEVIGPTNRNYWFKDSKNHNWMLRVDLLTYLENLAGPGRIPETRRIVCWDCTALCSMLIYPMMFFGYQFTSMWTPKKGEFFCLDDGDTIHTLVFRSKRTGTEIRIISLKQFVRGHNGLPDVYQRTFPDETPLGIIPVEPWDEPGQGGLRAIFEHSYAISRIWQRCFDSGYIYESSGRAISAGGIAWTNFKRELAILSGGDKPHQVLFPGMNPEQIREARAILEDALRPGCRGGTSFQRPGEYEHIFGYDLNSAYGAALDGYIPYGPLLAYPPKDDPCVGIVYPRGYFVLRQGRIPIISWPNRHDCQRYAWDRLYAPHELVYDFFLDGSLPFYQEEWETLLQFYEPAGAYEIPQFYYIAIMRWGLLGERMKRLYKMSRMYPDDKIFNKMQIVQLYGKLSQHDETENIVYVMKDGVPRRVQVTVGIQSQHLGIGMYVTSWCRIRIMKQLLRLFDAGVDPEDIVYIDTDSIYMQGRHDQLFDIDPETHGKWKLEQIDADMIIVGPKTYQIRKPDGTVKTTAASLPWEIKRTVRWGDLDSGTEYKWYEYQRDSETWMKAPRPKGFRARQGYLETDDAAYVVPEEIAAINGEYE